VILSEVKTSFASSPYYVIPSATYFLNYDDLVTGADVEKVMFVVCTKVVFMA
jgi:hypothetical protein